MKKYASYIDLKLASNPKHHNIKSPKNTGPSTFKRPAPLENPIVPILKEMVPCSSKAKYSAAYLQRKKLFSNKKENKDYENTKISTK